MRRVIPYVALLAASLATPLHADDAATRAVPHARAAAAGLPMAFVASPGGGGAFVARGPDYEVAVTAGVVAIARAGSSAGAVRRRLIDVLPDAAALGEQPLPTRVNVLVGADASQWRTNLSTYARVRVAQGWPGIDVVHYGTGGEFEHDFIVAPGADVSRIRLTVEGAAPVSIDESGDLVIGAGGEALFVRRPVAYQERERGRDTVSARFVLDESGAFGIAVASYDHARPLVIDPVVSWTATVGQAMAEDVAVDATGNVYVAGTTTSSAFQTASAYDSTLGGTSDAFLLKLTPDGQTVVFATYFGGADDDRGEAVAVAPDGDVVSPAPPVLLISLERRRAGDRSPASPAPTARICS